MIVFEVKLDTWPNMVRQLARAVVAKIGPDRAEQLGLTAAELTTFVSYTGRTHGGAVVVELDTWPRMLARMTLAVVDTTPRVVLASAVLCLPTAELHQRAQAARHVLS